MVEPPPCKRFVGGSSPLAGSKYSLCRKCSTFQQRRSERPPLEQLMKEVEELGFCGVGRKYGVSDNAIRGWLNVYKNMKLEENE